MESKNSISRVVCSLALVHVELGLLDAAKGRGIGDQWPPIDPKGHKQCAECRVWLPREHEKWRLNRLTPNSCLLAWIQRRRGYNGDFNSFSRCVSFMFSA